MKPPQSKWLSAGSIVATRLGLVPKHQIAETLWPYLPKPREWHHSRHTGSLTRENWWSKDDIAAARRANRAAKRKAKWKLKSMQTIL